MAVLVAWRLVLWALWLHLLCLVLAMAFAINMVCLDKNLLMAIKSSCMTTGCAREMFGNKEKLVRYIKEKTGIEVSTSAIFDVQVKRLHAYKRQLMNLLHIIKFYQDLQENPELKVPPRVFIFGAKAAPSYYFAKDVIKSINEFANLLNSDQKIKNKLKIIFLANYNVSLAELIIPAADVSEQISLASKEASGTSNTKLMLNGAVTIATLDGANIEIREEVGEDNIFIFGMDKDEVYAQYEKKDYCAHNFYEENQLIKRVVDALIDGSIPGIQTAGLEVFNSLIKYNDEYFTLLDFPAYCKAQEKIAEAYQNQEKWRKMRLLNTSHAGYFSADETVKRYAKEIWKIKPLFK